MSLRLLEGGASTAPALAPMITLLADPQAASADSGWPRAGQLPHMQVATGDCVGVVGVEHPPEQKAIVRCATPAADLGATVHSLLPDAKPAMSVSKIDTTLLLGTAEASIMTLQWRRQFFFFLHGVGSVSCVGLLPVMISRMGQKS